MSQTGKQLTLQCNLCTIGKKTRKFWKPLTDRSAARREGQRELIDKERWRLSVSIQTTSWAIFLGKLKNAIP